MSENKTKPSAVSVIQFLEQYPNQKVIEDCKILIKLFKKITKCEPVMWSTMFGFDQYHYKYESGREGDAFITGFAPSKVGITIYCLSDYPELNSDLAKLGKYKAGKSCLYIKKLSDIDLSVLTNIIKNTISGIKQKYKHN